MGRKLVMEKVNASLDGLEVRNAMREMGRRMVNQIRRIYQARRLHLLDNVDEACNWLTDNGIGWSDEQHYSVTIVATHCGITLAYDPSGKLSYATAPRLDRDGYPEQMGLFSDEPPGAHDACPAPPASLR